MTDERNERLKRADQTTPDAKPRGSRSAPKADARDSRENAVASEQGRSALPCWPFPVGSQNDTDKAVKLKPYVPPKRRTLNQY